MAFSLCTGQSDPIGTVENHRILAVLFIESPAKPTDKYDRELQPLTLVDTHDAHDIFMLTGHICLTVIYLVLLQLLHIPDKGKQTLVAHTLEPGCMLQQHLYIGQPPLTCRQHTHQIQIIALAQNLIQQIMYTQMSRQFPVAIDPFHEIAASIP